METSEVSAGLSFDKASYSTNKDEGPPCANCNGPLGEQYWHWQTKTVCEKCKRLLTETLDASQSKKAFGRAVLLGGATAFACGIAYAIFVGVTNYQLAIVTIGIAFLIAKVIRRCSLGIGGRKFQILAVALTYLASAMGYAPAVLSAMKDGAKQESAEHATASGAAGQVDDEKSGKASVAELATGIVYIFGVIMAAPFLVASQAPIGLLIVGFALWEAWKLSRGLPIALDGPYRAAPATGPPAE
ncbi:MAG TPA: hypothetical protein VL137_03110 [Polyangiaceae bacterium]|nr:hypothetical protein [Polyangiaceae bacterium]